MLEFFSLTFNLVGYYVRIGFAVYIAVMLLAFILALVITVVKEGQSRIKRTWFHVFSACTLVGFSGVAVLANESVGVLLLALSVCGIFNMIIFCLPEKKVRISDAPKELIRLIDREINSPQEQNQTFQSYRTAKNTVGYNHVAEIQKDNDKPQEDRAYELDFSHVKSVIERMEFFPLTATDKRQVRELENAVYQAEHGEFNRENKERINEGLGALLKIMSKYGV